MTFVWATLTFLLILYFAIHIPLDIAMSRRKTELTTHDVEEDQQANSTLGISSLTIWLGWLYYILYPTQGESTLQIVAVVFVAAGTVIAIWARILRGIHSHSWGLSKDTPLVTSGPYSLIRHPTYTFYFILSVFLPIATGYWVLLVTTISIYGYSRAVIVEEEMLVKHFGKAYEEYQKKTKKFIPFLW